MKANRRRTDTTTIEAWKAAAAWISPLLSIVLQAIIQHFWPK
jgi:hypothetical protein